MNRYIILYKAPTSVRERLARATPEEAQQGVQLWIDWQERVGDALLYPGAPIGQAMAVTSAGAAAAHSAVVGISILQAVDMEQVLDMIKDHHHLHWADGCEIEVLEEMSIPELGPAGASAKSTPEDR